MAIDAKPFRLLDTPGLVGSAGPQEFGQTGSRQQRTPEGATPTISAWKPGIHQNAAEIAKQRIPFEPIPKKPLPMK
jgi:hypothetical protein